jgi:flagellar motility protein MotE (MotC chaperone)
VPSALVAALVLAAAPAAPVAPVAPAIDVPAPPLGTGSTTEIPSNRLPAVNPSPSSSAHPSRDVTATPHPTAARRAADAKPTTRRPKPALRLSGLGTTATPPPPPRALPIAPRAAATPEEDRTPSIPPALSAVALRDELRAAARRRAEELRSLAGERARLQKLSADIAAARAALLSETALLERKLKEAPPPEKRPAAATAPARPSAPARRSGPEAKPPAMALAKTLKGMKPNQAASLLSRLERPLAVEILRHMRPADAGALLEKMQAETAAELITAMAAPADGAQP